MAINGVGFDSKETVQEFINKIKSQRSELVPSVSYYQKGTLNVPSLEASASTTIDVTLPTAMPDADYIVVYRWVNADIGNMCYTKRISASGFTIEVVNVNDTAYQGTAILAWQAFKLMTDESRALDEQAIADIQAVIPSGASESNQLVTERSAELVTIPLSKFQGSSGGAVGYLDLGVNTSSISQAFTLLEVEYGRVDGFMDKYLISLAGSSSNLNYIRVVRLTNYGQTPTITLDADKHIWMSMDTYVYIRVKAYGNFSISGTLSRAAPTGTAIPIDRLIKESDLTSSVTSGSTAPITSGAVATVKETADYANMEATTARSEIGDITSLETTTQDDLVSAINELVHRINAL